MQWLISLLIIFIVQALSIKPGVAETVPSPIPAGPNSVENLGTVLIENKNSSQAIKNLKWNRKEFSIQEKSGIQFVIIEWFYQHAENSLIYNKKKIGAVSKKDHRFELKVELEPKTLETRVEILEVSARGLVASEQIVLRRNVLIEKSDRPQASIETGKETHWQVSLGPTLIEHTETGYAGLKETVLTGKLSVLYPIRSTRFDFGANIFGSLVGVSKPAGDFLRFFGANSRVGFSLLPAQNSFSLSVMAGLYYITTFSANNSAGFKNMMGPQVFPQIRYKWDGQGLGAYVKYSPIAQGVWPSFLSRELAIGVNYSRPFLQKYGITVSIDYSDLYCNFSLWKMTTHSKSTTFSLGLAF